jgi:hypothetical protein
MALAQQVRDKQKHIQADAIFLQQLCAFQVTPRLQ